MTELNYKKKDFVSDQEVKWCPGCGDYSILNSVQQALTKIGKDKKDIAFVSGIGCSSRFPYYMNTFGMHTIHGRAPAIASGLKTHNPNLSVWVTTGDGDALSIGGNHLIHALRRNIDINIILFNNEIYGLTKGQFSPTSRFGQITKSSPYGTVDLPFSPAKLALGAGTTFFARTMDTDPKHMQEMFIKADQHKGVALVEVLQNCVIFNNKAHDTHTNRKTRDETTLRLEDGKPMIFGKENEKCICLENAVPTVKNVSDVDQSSILIHNEKCEYISNILSSMHDPLPIGIFKSTNLDTYETLVEEQIKVVTEKKGVKKVKDLLELGETWTVE